MISADDVHHAKAGIALAVTGVALPTSWLSDLDFYLRIILTVVGIITGIYSGLYYRRRYKDIKNGTSSSES